MCLPQGVEEGNRRDDVNIRIVDVQVQKVRIVADKMACAAVHGAKKKGDVVFVDGLVAEVEVFYIDGFGEQCELSQEGKDDGFVHAALAKLEGIFRSDVS